MGEGIALCGRVVAGWMVRKQGLTYIGVNMGENEKYSKKSVNAGMV